MVPRSRLGAGLEEGDGASAAHCVWPRMGALGLGGGAGLPELGGGAPPRVAPASDRRLEVSTVAIVYWQRVIKRPIEMNKRRHGAFYECGRILGLLGRTLA
jgi:hypothetical protein